MAFVKKTWKDRLVEFPGRRLLKRISGSADSQMVVDVTRNEGTVSQGGDAFSAANMNDLEQRIADEFGEVNNNLMFPDGTHFYPDSQNGKYGFNTDPQRGADTFRPFNSGKYHIALAGITGYGNSNVTLSLDKSYSKFLFICATASPNYTEVLVKSPSSGLAKIHVLSNGDCSMGFYEYSGSPINSIIVAPVRGSFLVLSLE